MSSILDALRKLEAEKAEAGQPTDEGFAEGVAERELVGRNLLRERLTIRLTPMTLVLSAVAFTALFMAISVGVSMMLIARAGREPAYVASKTPQPARASLPTAAPAPPQVPTVVGEEPEVPGREDLTVTPIGRSHAAAQASQSAEETVTPAPRFERPPIVAPATDAEGQPSPTRPADGVESQEKVLEPAQAEAKPAPSADETAQFRHARAEPAADEPQWRSPMMERFPSPAPTKPPALKEPQPVVDIEALAQHPLRERDRQRLGLTGFQINMLQPASKNRPYASAIINLNQVYLGEMIPRTNAKLIALDGLRGIVIEVQGSKERFYVPF